MPFIASCWCSAEGGRGVAQDSLCCPGKGRVFGLRSSGQEAGELLTQRANRVEQGCVLGIGPGKDNQSGDRNERGQRQKLSFALVAQKKEVTQGSL